MTRWRRDLLFCTVVGLVLLVHDARTTRSLHEGALTATLQSQKEYVLVSLKQTVTTVERVDLVQPKEEDGEEGLQHLFLLQQDAHPAEQPLDEHPGTRPAPAVPHLPFVSTRHTTAGVVLQEDETTKRHPLTDYVFLDRNLVAVAAEELKDGENILVFHVAVWVAEDAGYWNRYDITRSVDKSSPNLVYLADVQGDPQTIGAVLIVMIPGDKPDTWKVVPGAFVVPGTRIACLPKDATAGNTSFHVVEA